MYIGSKETDALFNPTRYTLVDTSLPNVKWAKSATMDYDSYTKKGTLEIKLEMDPFMEPLIYELAKKHPEWTFISDDVWPRIVTDDNNNQIGTVVTMEVFIVLHNREQLGNVVKTHFRRQPAYAMTNHRISAKRERGNSTKTNDLKKALRIIDRDFGRKNHKERLMELRGKGRGSLISAHNSISGAYQMLIRSMLENLEDHVAANFQHYRDIVVAAGMSPTRLDALPEKKEQYDIAHGVYERAFKQSEGLFVIAANSVYLALQDDKDESKVAYHTWTSDTVPDVVRRKIGLLKLVDNEAFLEGVGYRIDQDSFLILQEDENGE